MVLDPVIGKYSQLPDSGMVYRWVSIMPGAGRSKRPGSKPPEQSCHCRGVQGESPLLCSALGPRSQAGLFVYMQSLYAGAASPPCSLSHLCMSREGGEGPPSFIFRYRARLSQKASFSEATFPVQSFPERCEMDKSLLIRGLRHLRKFFPRHFIPA